MIKTEIYADASGRKYVRTYSDRGMLIKRGSVRYSVGVDPYPYRGKPYEETNTPIPPEDAYGN